MTRLLESAEKDAAILPVPLRTRLFTTLGCLQFERRSFREAIHLFHRSFELDLNCEYSHRNLLRIFNAFPFSRFHFTDVQVKQLRDLSGELQTASDAELPTRVLIAWLLRDRDTCMEAAMRLVDIRKTSFAFCYLLHCNLLRREYAE